MSKKSAKRTHTPAQTRTSHDALAREAGEWDDRSRTPATFVDAADAVPRASEATAISLRMPVALLSILKKFAEREGVGYQVLIKRWLDDRLRLERQKLRGVRCGEPASGRYGSRAPSFPLVDRGDDEVGHYRSVDR